MSARVDLRSAALSRIDTYQSSTPCRQAAIWLRRWLVLLLSLSMANAAAEDSRRQRDLFEIHVRPTLVKHCIKCHGDTRQEGGLRLTSLEHLLSGGDSGPAIVPGQPGQSLLVEALRYESLEMPPDHQLDKAVADGMAQWIKAGARWPTGLVLQPTPAPLDAGGDWWCYQPLGDPAAPQVDDRGWCRNPIDHFIFDALDQAGLEPAPPAQREVLVRRVHYAVTGLPPGEQVQTTIATAGDNDGWYEELVDQLLEGEAYGQNQARSWLDLVRYADSDGYNADHARPHARHYRDYVIRSFNADKPYDRFILEQLAGDEIDPGNQDALTATMYLRHWIYEWNQRDVEGQWRQILNDVTETTADVFLAQGLKCARCHDHKFDPLLQVDYYGMQAFFAALYPRDDLPIANPETRTRHLQQQRAWETATEPLRAKLHQIESPVLLANVTREPVAKFTKEIQSMIAARPIDRTPYQHQIASLASNQFDTHPEKISEWLDDETNARRQELLTQLAALDHLKPEPLPVMKFVVSDVGPVAPPTTIPGATDAASIAPAFPAVLDDQPPAIDPPAPALQSTGRRTALAHWIADPNHPLTARVIVNRLWQQHFGRGIVETTSDFGHLGAKPTHPELLDWLARRFVDDGWSLKKLHRLILTSATYRQSSRRPMGPQQAKLDPQNTLLWRMNSRRLSAEEIHDAMLWAAGELGPDSRAIYKPVKRNRLDPLLTAFDFPDRVESQCRRHCTTTAPQSLLLMNHPWLRDRARAMSNDLGSMSLDSLIDSAYQRLFFRPPSQQEREQALSFYRSYLAMTPEPANPERIAPLPDGRPSISFVTDQPLSITTPAITELNADPDNQGFTIEATVLLRSLYPDASVRTIVSAWTGNKSQPGWALGVTSTKSAYQPRNLILQLVGSRDQQQHKPEYEVVASNLRLELNKPYHIAVSIDPNDDSGHGITFFVRDLSDADNKPLTANIAFEARHHFHSNATVQIGGRREHHRWDGLIHAVRIHDAVVAHEDLFVDHVPRGPGAGPDRAAGVLLDVTFPDESRLAHDASAYARDMTVTAEQVVDAPPEQARVALLHALFNANELIYVD